LTALDQGKEVGRHPVSFTRQPPCSTTITITEFGDEVVLSAGKANEAGRLELDRQFPEVIFAPFSDRGQIVTPCYWGSHWEPQVGH